MCQEEITGKAYSGTVLSNNGIISHMWLFILELTKLKCSSLITVAPFYSVAHEASGDHLQN